MCTVRVSPTPPESWRVLVDEDPRATLFLDPRWMRVLETGYPHYESRYLIAEKDDEVVGLLPYVVARRLGFRQFLSLPFGTHGGPLVARDAPPVTARRLAERFFAGTRGPRTLRFELTVFDPSPELRQAFVALDPYLHPRETQVIDLTRGFDHLWSGAYDKETRTCVRRAEREGVVVEEERGDAACRVLHTLHRGQSEAWTGIRPHTLEAFRAATGVLGDDARILVARRQGEPLTACLYLYYRNREVYPWVSGSSPAARPVRAYHLLMNEALRHACENGYQIFNYGGSAGNPGIAYFKQSMGAQPRTVHRYFHVAGWMRRVRRLPPADVAGLS